jgi:hypothetical protein
LAFVRRIEDFWRAGRARLDEVWGLESDYDVLLKGLRELALNNRKFDPASVRADDDYLATSGGRASSEATEKENAVPLRRHLQVQSRRKAKI